MFTTFILKTNNVMYDKQIITFNLSKAWLFILKQKTKPLIVKNERILTSIDIKNSLWNWGLKLLLNSFKWKLMITLNKIM